jgi:hypothetical protein
LSAVAMASSSSIICVLLVMAELYRTQRLRRRGLAAKIRHNVRAEACSRNGKGRQTECGSR